MFWHFRELILELVALDVELQHVCLDRADLLDFSMSLGEFRVSFYPTSIFGAFVFRFILKAALKVPGNCLLHTRTLELDLQFTYAILCIPLCVLLN